MKLAFALFADSASATTDHKVDIQGADVDIVRAASFPAVHPIIMLVGSFILEEGDDTREHELRVEGASPSGEPWISPIVKTFTPTIPDPEMEPKKFVFILALPMLIFPHPGKYMVQVSMDGALVRELPLNAVVQAPATAEKSPESQHSQV